MHSAPSVTYPVGRSLFAGVLLLQVWSLAAAAIGLWWAHAGSPGWRLPVAALALVAVGAWAAWNWWRSPAGVLAWDGESWSWSANGRIKEGAPQVGLDLQRWLLVRWSGGASTGWVWLERGRLVERWDDLRRAVYSRARPDALQQAEPPAAKT